VHLFRIEQDGAEALTNILLPKFSITTLFLSNNRLGDKGGYFIANAMVIAEKDYFEEDLHADPDASGNAGMYDSNTPQVVAPPGLVDEEHVIQNCTVTYLDMSNNNLGGETMEALSFVLKSNTSLTHLNIDYSTAIKGNDLNHVFNQCRVFNKSLTRISIADTTRIAVNTFDNAMRIFQGYSILSALSFARCDLTSLHLRKSIAKISSAKYLTSLDLSGNKLSDQGIGFIIEAINESITVDKLPLKYLDVSNCGFTMHSALAISDMTSKKHTMAHLDMSDNDLSAPDGGKLSENVRNSRLKHLALNRCQLGSKKVEELLSELRYMSAGTCGSVLKTLLLSENDVQDSVDEALYCFLSTNKKLALLDLGFNRISEMGLLKAKTAIRLPTSASADVKVSELHINMMGNKCGQYALEYPGKARAKVTYQYGRELFDDPCHHISADAISDYAAMRTKFTKLSEKLAPSSVKFNAVS
jgi:Ran GTPase-activating protein (RanGAP) involved in mRNA processing and transport